MGSSSINTEIRSRGRSQIAGTLMWIQGMDIGESEKRMSLSPTRTVNSAFTGYRAWHLAVGVQKRGYEIGKKSEAYKAPNPEDRTSPSGRAVFTMWKLKGAEPMVHREIAAGLSCDGSPMTLDLLTGHRVANGGDLTISMTRSPVNIERGKSFDWSLILTVTGGGIVEIAGLYPNEAPEAGYEPSVVKNFHVGLPYFIGNALNQSYYFKSRGGQIYGRMKMHISADHQPHFRRA